MSLGRGGPPRVQSGPLFRRQDAPRDTSTKTTSPPPHPPGQAGAAESRETGGKFGRLKFSEVHGDLFQCPPSASLAHCVSEDMSMGKGIAKIFKSQFGGMKELKEQGYIAWMYIIMS